MSNGVFRLLVAPSGGLFKSQKNVLPTMERFDHVCNVVGLLGETIKVQEGLSLTAEERAIVEGIS